MFKQKKPTEKVSVAQWKYTGVQFQGTMAS